MEEGRLETLEQREAHGRLQEEHERAGAAVPWIRQLAVATAIFAVLAAISGLVANRLAEEALLQKTEASISQNQASDWWAFFQAKSIKQDVLSSEITTLKQAGVGAAVIAPVERKLADEGVKKADGQAKAEAAEKERDRHDEESKVNGSRHTIFSGAVTLFQVSIALAAIAALTRLFWAFGISLLVGGAGLLTMLWGGIQLMQKAHG